MDSPATPKMSEFAVASRRVLHLEPTTVCNARCPQCPRTEGDLPNLSLRPGELRLADVQRLVPESFVRQLDKMFMCGNYGEPAAAQDCLAIFRWFKEVNPGIVLGMNTNGSLRTPAWWAELATVLNGPLDYVVWSIDGLADTNYIYRRDTVWSKIMANAAAFVQAGGSAHWDMLVFKHNQHQVQEAEDVAREMGFTWFRSKATTREVHHTVRWLEKIDLPAAAPLPEISCHYEAERAIYLSAHGEWLPCCYIGSLTDVPGPNVVKTAFSPPITSLNAFDANPVVTAVVASWDTEAPFAPCSAACSKTAAGVTLARSKWKTEVQLR